MDYEVGHAHMSAYICTESVTKLFGKVLTSTVPLLKFRWCTPAFPPVKSM